MPMDQIVGNTLLGDINATVHNNPTLVVGILGKALQLNGIDQWADFGSPTQSLVFGLSIDDNPKAQKLISMECPRNAHISL